MRETLYAIPVLKTIYYRGAQMTEVDKLIELQALICEREAMVEENECRERQGYAHAWPGSCFNELAEAMRALKTVEAKPEQHTTAVV